MPGMPHHLPDLHATILFHPPFPIHTTPCEPNRRSMGITRRAERLAERHLCRPSSASQHMRQLLTEFDSHITHTRMLASPSPPPSRPRTPISPAVCPVNITFHGTPGDGPRVMHEAPHSTDASRGNEQHRDDQQQTPAHAAVSPTQGGILVHEHGHHGDRVHQHQPHVHSAPSRPRSEGRRHRFGCRQRVSASDIVPPEKVGEEALQQARIEYYADVQRLKQKRLQDWGQMFGQVP